MGFTSYEKPHYDLGNNGYLPENVDHFEKTIPNWKKYITKVVELGQHEELVIIPTSPTRIRLIERGYPIDALLQPLGPTIRTNFFDPNVLRTNLITGSPIVNFVLRHNITGHSYFSIKELSYLHSNLL